MHYINDVLKKLCKRILKVYSESDILTGEFDVILFKDKFSSSRNKSIRMIHNGDVIKTIGYKVDYFCSCGNINSILLKKFLYKESDFCKKCNEKKEDKRLNQSNYVKQSFIENGKIVKKERYKKLLKNMSINEIIEHSLSLFNNESDDFKSKYLDDTIIFDNIKDKIKIPNKDINVSECEFLPIVRCGKSYSPKISNGIEIFSLYEVEYKCDSCNNSFIGRYLKERSKNHKILCRRCNLSNKTFKIKNIKNINDINIIYQSKPELKLIEYCNKNNILIENGPNIQYSFNGKLLKYRVDFKIKNFLVEIKDNHIWHKNEVLSGKWSKKEKSAIEYCKKNNLLFKLIMNNELDTFLMEI